MQKFPVPLQGLATKEQLAALKQLNVFSFSTQVFASYEDWISKTGYAPPFDPERSPQLWADGTAWSGRWYVFAGPAIPVEQMLQDRISCGIYSPGAYTFYRTNAQHFKQGVPRLTLSWRTNGAVPNIPTFTMGDQYPIGWLESDPVGPIDFIEGNRIRGKHEGPAPNGEKYRVNGFRSDFAAIYEAQTLVLFPYAEWRP